jgi:hypothetical protein
MSITPPLGKTFYKMPSDDYIKHPEKYELVQKLPTIFDSIYKPVVIIIRPKENTAEGRHAADQSLYNAQEDIHLGLVKHQTRQVTTDAEHITVGNASGTWRQATHYNDPTQLPPLEMGYPNEESRKSAT